MLMLTRDAADVIKKLADAPGAEGVRISGAASSPLDGQASAMEIRLASAPEAEDAVVDADGAHIFIAPEAVTALDDKLLDADLEGENVRFAIMDQAQEEPGA